MDIDSSSSSSMDKEDLAPVKVEEQPTDIICQTEPSKEYKDSIVSLKFEDELESPVPLMKPPPSNTFKLRTKSTQIETKKS